MHVATYKHVAYLSFIQIVSALVRKVSNLHSYICRLNIYIHTHKKAFSIIVNSVKHGASYFIARIHIFQGHSQDPHQGTALDPLGNSVCALDLQLCWTHLIPFKFSTSSSLIF